MKKILIVNGEKYWHEYLAEFEVYQINIQESSWILKEEN